MDNLFHSMSLYVGSMMLFQKKSLSHRKEARTTEFVSGQIKVIRYVRPKYQIMKKPNRARTATSYIWFLHVEPPDNPVVLYRYHPQEESEFRFNTCGNIKNSFTPRGTTDMGRPGNILISRMPAAGPMPGVSSMEPPRQVRNPAVQKRN